MDLLKLFQEADNINQNYIFLLSPRYNSSQDK